MGKHNVREVVGGLFNLVGNIFRIVSIPLFLAGLLALISPTMFFSLMENLPEDIQYVVANDMIFSSFPLSWSYMIGGVALWFVGSYIKK